MRSGQPTPCLVVSVGEEDRYTHVRIWFEQDLDCVICEKGMLSSASRRFYGYTREVFKFDDYDEFKEISDGVGWDLGKVEVLLSFVKYSGIGGE